MNWRRYILHIVVILTVIAAMTAPAWSHLPWRYLLSSLATGLVFVVLALAIAASLVPNTEEEEL